MISGHRITAEQRMESDWHIESCGSRPRRRDLERSVFQLNKKPLNPNQICNSSLGLKEVGFYDKKNATYSTVGGSKCGSV